jgi:hypothetical protein
MAFFITSSKESPETSNRITPQRTACQEMLQMDSTTRWRAVAQAIDDNRQCRPSADAMQSRLGILTHVQTTQIDSTFRASQQTLAEAQDPKTAVPRLLPPESRLRYHLQAICLISGGT